MQPENDYSIDITPNENLFEMHIQDLQNGTFYIQFTTNSTGSYNLSVSTQNHGLSGSPYGFQMLPGRHEG